jgi:D-3-phosphoglycerate dehydrogenase
VVSAGGSGNPNATAELTWGLILSSLRNLPFEVTRLKGGQWQSTLGIGVNGKTIGIYAYGKIGSIVAAVGRAFGARVVCWGREGSTGRAKAAGFDVAKSREEFFAEADIVSLHLPLNNDTRGIVTREDLGRMKPTARIVNASRSGLIAKGALIEALKAGRPGFAAVDVYDEEPVGANEPLTKMDNVTCTPHLGYVTRESYEEYYAVVVDDIVNFAAGKPSNVLNPDALKK